MKRIKYFIIETQDTIDGEIEILDSITEKEIEDIMFELASKKTHGNKWTIEWDIIDEGDKKYV